MTLMSHHRKARGGRRVAKHLRGDRRARQTLRWSHHPARQSPVLNVLDCLIDLGQGETRDRQIEIEIEFFQLQKTFAEQPLVPVRMLSQPVVRDPKRLQLCRRQVPDLHDRYPRHPELSGGENPAVPDHHLPGVVDHDRHDKPELADAVRNLIDLTLRMLSRIAGIQNEISDGSIVNLNLDQAGVGRCVAPSGVRRGSHRAYARR